MEHSDKIKKATAELVALLVEGDKRLEKYRRTLVRVKLGSLGLTFIAVAIAVFPPHAIAITSALLGIAGGVCVGISLIYDASLLTWPIVRPLLDEGAVQRFISENKG